MDRPKKNEARPAYLVHAPRRQAYMRPILGPLFLAATILLLSLAPGVTMGVALLVGNVKQLISRCLWHRRHGDTVLSTFVRLLIGDEAPYSSPALLRDGLARW